MGLKKTKPNIKQQPKKEPVKVQVTEVYKGGDEWLDR